MTMRQLHFCLKHIDIRKHNNYSMQAALHGHKIKMRGIQSKLEPEKFTDKENDRADRAMKKAIQRMKVNKQFRRK